MEEILDIITSLYDELSVYIQDYMLLIAGSGALFLLLILMLARRKRRGDNEFVEVGPEPVIVYGRRDVDEDEEDIEQPKKAKKPKKARKKQARETESVEVGDEPVIVYRRHEEEQEETEPDPEPHPAQIPEEFVAAVPAPEPLPSREPVLDPEPQPVEDADSGLPGGIQQTSPLPYLSSKLANDVLEFFNSQNFRIEQVVYQGIFGGDFIAVRGGIRAYVQVKDWKKKVTVNSLDELRSFAQSHHCNKAILITAGRFGRPIAKAAERMNIYLWNQKHLRKMLKKQPFPLADEAAAAGE
ncbi:MAG: restriction endonuclease [Firmicutes bacterium]|nr:restriction endonuclease [Bacillota bacterium]HOB34538.1 restriction endonuclease [Bacillota bacterium]HPZ90574.1 restriction endonuclease [Bacillota bacterium]HQE02373.1 restriction endonuclease [Bacillota bacterium]